jgi:hypothetical protein
MRTKYEIQIQPNEVKKLLGIQSFPFTVTMEHRSMSIEYFTTDKIDNQTPHKQDEIYVIVNGDDYFRGWKKSSL